MDKKRILLIEPPFNRLYHDNYSLLKYPLWQGYLSGAILTNTDWDVMAYNSDFNIHSSINVDVEYLAGKGFQRYIETLNNPSAPIWKEVENTIREYSPSVVGIGAKSQFFTSACLVAKITKMVSPDTYVILGGPHASMDKEAVLECEDIDISCIGEGEETLVDILKTLENKSPDLGSINGICYRNKFQGNVETAPRVNMENLDDLQYPILSAEKVLKDFHAYPAEAFGYIFATRGCPYQCTFCGSVNIWSRKVRWRTPRDVVDEIKEIAKYTDHIYFDDDTFGVKKEFIRELLTLMIEECSHITWGCEISVKLISDELVSLMKKSRCTRINLGVESGNDEMLIKIKKHITVSQILTAVDVIRHYNIQLGAFFILGFPEETEETLNDTMSLMKKIKATIVFSIFTPYPGTDTFEQCRELGLVDDTFDVSLYNHQSPENHFSAYIEKERFHELVRQAIKIVDRKNDIKKVLKVVSYMSDRGFMDTLKIVTRNVKGKILAR